MIIVGYPGVGKSTLVQHKENCIDLESSCFDKSNINWYKIKDVNVNKLSNKIKE